MNIDERDLNTGQGYQGPVAQDPPVYQENVRHEVIHIVPISDPCNKMHDKHSRIPIIHPNCAVLILIMNILLPGWGTVTLACFSEEDQCYYILIGLLQFVLAGLIVGWVWSIITGVQVLKRSRHYHD